MSLGRYVGIVDIRTVASEARLRKLTTAVVDFERATLRATPQTTLFGKRVYEVVPAAREAEAQVGRFGRVTGILSGMIVKASIMSFVLNLMFARIAHTTERVRDLQERYNEVVEKFGPASAQAERALRNLRLAQEDLTRATREQYIQFVLFGSQAVLVAKDLIDLIRNLRATRGALAGLAALRAVPARLGAAVPFLRFAGPLGIAALAAFAFGAIVPPLVWRLFQPREEVRPRPPPPVVEARLRRIRLEPPPVVVEPFREQIRLATPRIFVEQPAPISIAAPAITVRRPSPISIDAPAITVGRPSPVSIEAPAITVRRPAPVSMEAPAITVETRREEMRLESRVTVEAEEGIEVKATKTRRYVARELSGLTQMPGVG